MSRNVLKVICPDCGQEISKSNFTKHQRRHKDHPETFVSATYSLNHEGLDCQFCGKTCKNRNSLCNHERLCKENPNKQERDRYIPGFNTVGHKSWNKGLTKDTDARVAKGAETFHRNFEAGKFTYHSKPSPNTYGFRYKYGSYKGFYCDSSWELAFVMYCVDHRLDISRNYEYFIYIDDIGKERYFYPDFKINNTFYEIKGGYDRYAQLKFDQFPKKYELVWLDVKGIQKYIKYAKEVYGNDYIKLYDRNHKSWMDKLDKNNE